MQLLPFRNGVRAGTADADRRPYFAVVGTALIGYARSMTSLLHSFFHAFRRDVCYARGRAAAGRILSIGAILRERRGLQLKGAHALVRAIGA